MSAPADFRVRLVTADYSLRYSVSQIESAYGGEVPSVDKLRRDLEVSRATAYRYRAALRPEVIG